MDEWMTDWRILQNTLFYFFYILSIKVKINSNELPGKSVTVTSFGIQTIDVSNNFCLWNLLVWT